jgi:hypothetical protein
LSVEQLDRLTDDLLDFRSLADLQGWLTSHAAQNGRPDQDEASR